MGAGPGGRGRRCRGRQGRHRARAGAGHTRGDGHRQIAAGRRTQGRAAGQRRRARGQCLDAAGAGELDWRSNRRFRGLPDRSGQHRGRAMGRCPAPGRGPERRADPGRPEQGRGAAERRTRRHRGGSGRRDGLGQGRDGRDALPLQDQPGLQRCAAAHRALQRDLGQFRQRRRPRAEFPCGGQAPGRDASGLEGAARAGQSARLAGL